MRTVQVELGSSSYPIYIGAGAVKVLPGVLAELTDWRQVVVVTDPNVARWHLGALHAALPGEPVVVQINPGEASKSLETVARLYDELAAARIGRLDVLIGLGGGVVGDVAGFVAGTWHRGMRLVQVPTTLEAALDASVGGKTAINHPSGKNLIGVFHQPVAVVIDLAFLQTLGERELRAGLAESVKHALIADATGADCSEDFLTWHERQVERILARDAQVLEELTARSCAIKAAVVAQDERESGLRAILNFGHTVGHALERLLEYELRHGECVALGMIVACELSVGRNWLEREAAERLRCLLSRLGLPMSVPRAVRKQDVVAACQMDKKVRAGRVHFILLRGIGRPVCAGDVTSDELERALAWIQASD
jgi:3-dehydroquinate synthase